MTRHTVWVRFEVDASSPEQAEGTIHHIIKPSSIGEADYLSFYRIDATVLTSPKLDEMFGEVEDGRT